MDKMPKPKSFGFGLQALKRRPELIPLVTIMSVAVTGCISYCVYCLLTKPDVTFVGTNGNIKTSWESVKPTQSRKLRVVNKDTYKAIQEVEDLKREIGSYKN